MSRRTKIIGGIAAGFVCSASSGSLLSEEQSEARAETRHARGWREVRGNLPKSDPSEAAELEPEPNPPERERRRAEAALYLHLVGTALRRFESSTDSSFATPIAEQLILAGAGLAGLAEDLLDDLLIATPLRQDDDRGSPLAERGRVEVLVPRRDSCALHRF